MYRLLKNKFIILFISALVVLEILLRLFWGGTAEFRQNPLDSKFAALRVALKQKPLFYQQRFCDSIHQTKTGEMDVARCIQNDISVLTGSLAKKNISILTAGASTTHGQNCDSGTSWPKEFLQSNPDYKIINLAEDGGYSDESILKIEKSISEKNIPDILIWGHGFTEFLFYGDQRDINWSELSKNTELIEALKKDRVYKENFLLKILRIDITVQKYIYLYKFLRVKMNLAFLSIQSGYLKFLLTLSFDEKNETNSREDHVATGGVFSGPVRSLFSQASQKYSLENYRANLKRLSALSQKYNFKVVCVKFPFVKDLLVLFSPEFSNNYDSWLKMVNSVTDKTCKELNFTLADVDRCYQKNQ